MKKAAAERSDFINQMPSANEASPSAPSAAGSAMRP